MALLLDFDRVALALVLCMPACGDSDDPASNTEGGDGGPGGNTMMTVGVTLTNGTGDDDDDTAEDTATSGDDDDDDDDDDDADGTTGDTTGGPLVECEGGCIELPPNDWNGPVVVLESDVAKEAPDCPESFTEIAAEGFEDLVAPPATCGCSCGDVSGALCDPIANLVVHGDGEDCEGPQVDNVLLSAGNCIPVGAIGVGADIRAEPVEVVAGACEPDGTSTIDDATFTTRVTACAPDDPPAAGTTCDEDGLRCVPNPPEVACIWQQGEHDCPVETSYAASRAIHTSFTDDRSCTECTCDDAVGLCDAGSITLYSIMGCNAPIAGNVVTNGFCTEAFGTALTARYIPEEATAFCPAAVVEPVGEALVAEPITLCCTQ